MLRLPLLCSVTVPVAIVTTILRYIVNRTFTGARLGRRQASSDTQSKLVEEVWLMVASSILLAFSTWAVERHNNQCSFLDQSGCFVGWPNQVVSRQVDTAMAGFLGWYIHGLIKSLVPGVGLRSGALSHPLYPLLL